MDQRYSITSLPRPRKRNTRRFRLPHLGPITWAANISYRTAGAIHRAFPSINSKATHHFVAISITGIGFYLAGNEKFVEEWVRHHASPFLAGATANTFPWLTDIIREAGLSPYIERLASMAKIIKDDREA